VSGPPALSVGSRRRLLFLLPFPPRLDATHGGSRAMAQILAALTPRHDVAALYLRGRDEPAFDPALALRCALVEEVARDAGPALLARAAHRGRVTAARLRGVPYWAAYWGAGAYADHARRLADAWRPDVVHLEYHVMGQFAHAVSHARASLVLTSYEPAAAAATERAGAARGLRRHAARLEARLWSRFERAVMGQADAVVAFTERDRDALAPLAGRTPVVHIPLGTSLPPRALGSEGVEPPEVLFVGNYMHPPNVDAALHLVRDLAPRVWARVPDVRFVLVGPNPPDALRALAEPRVQVTGEVDDVTPYLDRAAVVAAPIRLGGGMRVKVLEALASGKAVVGTPRAVEGLALCDGEQLRVAEGEAALADAIADLVEQPAARRALGDRARAWACATFDPDRWAAAYDALYADLAGRRAARPARD
jgi:glycosyltransferase involved in cell wall biosynthesis